jgi:hypothetical protein
MTLLASRCAERVILCMRPSRFRQWLFGLRRFLFCFVEVRGGCSCNVYLVMRCCVLICEVDESCVIFFHIIYNALSIASINTMKLMQPRGPWSAAPALLIHLV